MAVSKDWRVTSRVRQPTTFLLASKIGRRTLLLFALSALLPILLFSFQSNSKIDSLYQDQLVEELNQSAKGFGLTVFERLKFLNQSIEREYQAKINAENTHQTFTLYQDAVSIGEGRFLAVADPLLIQEFAKVKSSSQGSEWLSLFKIQGAFPQAECWIYKTTATNDSPILGVQLDSKFLWDDFNTFDLTKKFKIYDENHALIYESFSDGAEIKKEDALSSNWSLFLGAYFGNKSWEIESENADSNAFAERDSFKKNAYFTTCLALLLAGIVGSYSIRKSTEPLGALQRGIDQINNNNFSHKVAIESKDEYELLGNTFNSMTSRLGRHIGAIESLSKIDQLILNRLKIEDIVEVVLHEGVKLLNAKQIIFAVRNVDDVNYAAYSFAGLLDPDARFTASALQDFGNNNLSNAVHQFPLSLQNTMLGQLPIYRAVLKVDGHDKAIFLAQFNSEPDKELLNLAATFSDHIAVALSNADWEARLFQHAHYDSLTGLANRFYFNTHLEDLVKQASTTELKIALYFIDIDNFKSLNDAKGHMTGDSLLQKVANKLQAVGDKKQFVARLGGDEFTLIQVFDENSSRSHVISQSGTLAEEIRLAGRESIKIDGNEIQLSLSIGIALFPFDGASAQELLLRSDEAMYQAKSEGKNAFRFYSDSDNSSAVAKIQLIGEMRRALIEDEFELYYQPKVDPFTGELDGCEALVRWNHPQRGLLGPGYFIPHAEETGFINDLGEWIIRKAAQQQHEWLMADKVFGRIAINVSLLQLVRDDFCHEFISALDKSGCPGSALEIEITETAYVDDLTKIREQLLELSKTGVTFSVDDYGTGHSTLSLLLNLPVCKLKIDKSFIDDIQDSKTKQAIVESTIKLAQKVGLSVVAEGVESYDQLAILTEFGCDSIQGYYFSKPVAASHFEKLMTEKYFLPLIASQTATPTMLEKLQRTA